MPGALEAQQFSASKTQSPVLTAGVAADQRRTNPDSSEHEAERPSRFDQTVFQDVIAEDSDVPARNHLQQTLPKEQTPNFMSNLPQSSNDESVCIQDLEREAIQVKQINFM